MFQPWARNLKIGVLAADESGANAWGSEGCQGSNWLSLRLDTGNQVQESHAISPCSM